MGSAPPLYEGIIGLGIALTPAVLAVVAVYRGRSERLAMAGGLALWGLILVFMEHGIFGLSEFGGFALRRHEGFHFQMLATYGLVAIALVAVVVVPLIRRGETLGWWGLLIVLIVGVGTEIATAVITTPHGVPPRWWSWGLALWAYPVAWGTALVLSFPAVFHSGKGGESGPVPPW